MFTSTVCFLIKYASMSFSFACIEVFDRSNDIYYQRHKQEQQLWIDVEVV